MKTQTRAVDTLSDLGSLPGGSFVRQSQLIPAILPFSSATLWRKVRDGSFPKPVKLSDRITAWRSEDVQHWMASRKP